MLADTSAWSLAFRRDADQQAPEVVALRAALEGGEPIVITGIILQELLQGFTGPKARKDLLQKFAALPMLMPDRADHVGATFKAGMLSLTHDTGYACNRVQSG